MRTDRLTVQEHGSKGKWGTVRQRYAIKSDQVVPEIITSDDARAVFVVDSLAPRELRFVAQPDGAAEYRIVAMGDNYRRLIARKKITRVTKRCCNLRKCKARPAKPAAARFRSASLRRKKMFQTSRWRSGQGEAVSCFVRGLRAPLIPFPRFVRRGSECV